MSSLFQRPFKNEFARNVMTLMTGTGLGQVFALLMAPIISRLYTPEQFSTLEQFAMLLAILAVFSTGKYEFAIMQPKEDRQAAQLVNLALRIAVVTSAIVLILLLFFRGHVADWYKNPELADWLLLLPIALFFFAVFNALNYWFSRQKKYRKAAFSKALFSFVSEPVKALGALAGLLSGGLVVGVVVGRITAGFYMLRAYLNDVTPSLRKYDRDLTREMAREYRDYPLFTTWGSTLNRLSQWAHIFLFSYFFGLVGIGFFALSRRLFQNPLNIISGSYSQVFYQRISEISNGAELRSYYYKNLVRFLFFAAFMVAFVQILPDQTMAWIFGKEWGGVLEYLKILSFWYGMNFVSGALSFINYRLRKQRMMLLLDAFHFVVVIASICIPAFSGCGEMETLKFLVAGKVLVFSTNILFSISFVEKEAAKERQ